MTVIQDIFPEKMLKRILSILSIKKFKCEHVCDCTCSLITLQKKCHNVVDNSVLVELHSHSESNETIAEKPHSEEPPEPPYKPYFIILDSYKK